MAIEHTIWPLTIVADRYNGMYAGGLYIALHCKPDEIPARVLNDELYQQKWWKEYWKFTEKLNTAEAEPCQSIYKAALGFCVAIGVGNTPNQALHKLINHPLIQKSELINISKHK